MIAPDLEGNAHRVVSDHLTREGGAGHEGAHCHRHCM